MASFCPADRCAWIFFPFVTSGRGVVSSWRFCRCTCVCPFGSHEPLTTEVRARSVKELVNNCCIPCVSHLETQNTWPTLAQYSLPLSPPTEQTTRNDIRISHFQLEMTTEPIFLQVCCWVRSWFLLAWLEHNFWGQISPPSVCAGQDVRTKLVIWRNQSAWPESIQHRYAFVQSEP